MILTIVGATDTSFQIDVIREADVACVGERKRQAKGPGGPPGEVDPPGPVLAGLLSLGWCLEGLLRSRRCTGVVRLQIAIKTTSFGL